jgi:FKBP-type peptidyl-prolyl cis-trans isomerase
MTKEQGIAVVIAIAVVVLFPFLMSLGGFSFSSEDGAAGTYQGDTSVFPTTSIPMNDIPLDSDELVQKDITVGTGATVVAGSSVTVEYTGALTDGRVFDSSVGRDPFVFTVGNGDVIAGWDQGLLGMQEGGERILVIPPALGYGAIDLGVIPPNSTLVFSVRVLKVD